MINASYLELLAACLRRYGLDSKQIEEIITEVESHLAKSKEAPLDAFGPPDAYAKERFAAREHVGDGEWQHRTFRATAFDEMLILQEAGMVGWELSDVAALALYCRRPWDLKAVQQWEYARCFSFNRNAIINKMIADGWQPCGNWILFHYFKRPIRLLSNE